MSPQAKLQSYIDTLQLPEADRSKLSFCAGKKPSKIQAWLNGLHTTKTSETAAIFYTALPEISRLKIDPVTRLEMFEAVRPVAQNTIKGLTRDLFNQSVNTSPEAQKTFIVAQSIQKAMIDGYTRCVTDICQVKKIRPQQTSTLTIALHRAITGVGLVFLRNYQLYSHLPSGFWLRLHALFQIADSFDLLAKPVLDDQLQTTRATNIQSAYTRVLLMATAKLNQVSQQNISLLFDAFEIWAQYVRLHTSNFQDKELFYLLNLSADRSPVYKSRFEGNANDRVVQLNLKVLVSLLSKHSPSKVGDDEEQSGSLNIPIGFPDSLIEHMLGCWSTVSQRQQERQNVHTTAEVCIGLVNAHYYVNGGQDFDTFASQTSLEGDLKQGAFNTITSGASGLFDLPESGETQSSPPTHKISIQNVSAGGCCLVWKGSPPSKLQSGELIGYKEAGRHGWSIGVVRWIRQFKDSTQLGVQTLTTQPKPYGASQLYDMGGYSDYMRALYIPALKSGQGPASILTAFAPFKEYDKVKIFDGVTTITAKLTKVLFSTGSIRQFAYHPLESTDKQETRKKVSKQFDNDWD
ncbi:PilZ domain-containing protein [Teredinibacter haidensis]|uniref:PilZ domain-containing protein n=1 Tax=Teredinibacter haidensis TaxID=2731755 RepID=UPI0009489F15|nr:PilZ domain-containing protein [Teredinibacter haidensis]